MSLYTLNRNAAYGLGCSTSLYSQAVFMPQAIGALFISFLSSAGALVGVTNALGFIGTGALALGVGYAVTAAAAIGLSLALQKKPAAPQPSDVQSNIRQEISARRRIYGRYLVGSVVVFGFRRGEKSYILHYLGEGPIHDYVSFRLDKKPVTLDANGFVTEDQYVVDGRSRVQILTTKGLMTDEPFQAILDAFPELDTPLTPFRHRGCAMALQIVEQVPADKLQDVYPNNMPGLQFVIDGLDNVLDPRTMMTGFSSNAACCLLTEIMDVYGLSAADDEEINFASFVALVDRSDEDVALKAGGSEKRYRCAGVITLDGENEDRIQSIGGICNAEVYIDPQGRIAAREKMRSTPGIALRAKNGDHLGIQMEGGRPLQKRFNTAKVTYVDPNLNWKANEVRWQHPNLLDDDGAEMSNPISAQLCPSATQAMRLSKLAVMEGNPDFVGSLTSGPQALDLIEDYMFTLDLSPEDAFDRVAAATGVVEYDGEQMTVQTGFAVFQDGAADWNPAVDEQEQVVIPPELPSYVDDVALNVTVSAVVLAGTSPSIRFAWAAASGTLPDSYSQQVQVSAADADDWHDASVNQTDNTAQYAPVAIGGAYDWRIRNIASGKTFDWQVSTTPVTVGAGGVVYAQAVLNKDTSGWSGFTLRQIIAASALAAVGGAKVRVTLEAAAAAGYALSAAYIGYAAASGDAYDFEGTPTQLLFGGAAGVTASAGQKVVSDAVAFAPQPGKNLIVAMYFGGTSSVRAVAALANYSAYYKSGSDAATVNASGYTAWGDNGVGVTLIELLT